MEKQPDILEISEAGGVTLLRFYLVAANGTRTLIEERELVEVVPAPFVPAPYPSPPNTTIGGKRGNKAG